MKILVTGHNGWIGKKVFDRLSENDDHEVLGFDSGLMHYQHWEHHWLEWSSYGNLHSENQPELVIHVGGLSDSRADAKACFDANFLPTAMLWECARKWQAKFLYFSSCMAIDPSNAYGYSKYAAEQMLLHHYVPEMYKEHVCIFRPFNVWGYDEGNKRNPSIVSKFMSESLEYMFADCIRDFVHVDSVVQAVIQVVENWRSGVYEIGTGIGTHVTELPYIFGKHHLFDGLRVIPSGDRQVKGYEPIRVANTKNMLPGWHPPSFRDTVNGKSLEGDEHIISDNPYLNKD